MSSNHHARHAVHAALHLTEQLRPLPEKKDPMTAALCGFFAGGVGLGLYFKSWTDFFVPVVLWTLCAPFIVSTFGMAILFAAFFCAAYGYRRAKASNEKREQQIAATVIDVTPYAASAVPPPLLLPPQLPSSAIQMMRTPIEERLATAMSLWQQKYISDAEYEKKRREILNGL